MEEPEMLPWAAEWLDAARQSANAALAAGEGGRAQGQLAIIALHNATIALTKALGNGHHEVQKLKKACPDLKAARDMLSHFEDYVLGNGKLQKPAKAALNNGTVTSATRPGRVAWLPMWNGSSGATEYQELLILTHTDDSGTPTVFVINLQETLKAVATAVDAAAKLAGASSSPRSPNSPPNEPDNLTGGVKDLP